MTLDIKELKAKCEETNHHDWRYIDHQNLGRVHVCRICDTVVGTG